jgi:hypothetical protein
MRMPTKNTLFCILSLTCALQVSAQVTQLKGTPVPQDLEWELMKEVSFNSKTKNSANDPDWLQTGLVWNKELGARPQGTFALPDGGQYQGITPASAIIAGTPAGDRGKSYFLFSLYKSKGTACDKPALGRSGPDQYSKCTMRAVRFNRDFKVLHQQDVADFCYLHYGAKDSPLALNYTSLAYDPRSNIVHFRVIQDGKLVPACNRAVRIN